MPCRRRSTLVAVVAAVLAAASLTRGGPQRRVEIPRTWDDEAMRTFEIPLANAAMSPKYVPADYYYRIPVRPIYKSYPIYHPDREPRGYLAKLATLEPQIVFDASKLESDADWIRAGEMVFDAPIEFLSGEELNTLVRTRSWYANNRVLVTKDGVFPNMRYVVREKGKVEVGILACGQCHTRVMPNGTSLKGAQGNFPDDRSFAYETRLAYRKAKDRDAVLKNFRAFLRRSYATPWLEPDPISRAEQMSLEQLLPALEAITPGVCARQGTSIFSPARIPDLIGLRDRRYFDASGHVRHRSIADLMRYAAVNQGGDMLSTYGNFRPVGELPDPSKESRYSDEQLYALARYLYSLEPPPNPNRFGALAARGQKVFEREGCVACHTPPLYTNNRLTPAAGFDVPDELPEGVDVVPISVGTDTDLTLRSRRGTGYYKVPSLRGLWYRGPLGHGGAVASLEDWFDPRRVRDDYVPTGFRGAGVRRRAVPGHPFGLNLSSADRRALIAFLRTL
jgi:hypothetical protein